MVIGNPYIENKTFANLRSLESVWKKTAKDIPSLQLSSLSLSCSDHHSSSKRSFHSCQGMKAPEGHHLHRGTTYSQLGQPWTAYEEYWYWTYVCFDEHNTIKWLRTYTMHLYYESDDQPEHLWAVILPFEITRIVWRGIFWAFRREFCPHFLLWIKCWWFQV